MLCQHHGQASRFPDLEPRPKLDSHCLPHKAILGFLSWSSSFPAVLSFYNTGKCLGHLKRSLLPLAQQTLFILQMPVSWDPPPLGPS